ncbi:DUF86 domain-containing protein [candidate division KSB1 bacterium]|nr:DUF86 domain-containing protein [candidate division KSB1 bacterium]
MSKRNYKLYIEDILESIEKIKRYTKGMRLEELSKDNKTIDAVVRNFEIIGEASRQLPEAIKTRYPEVDWRAMIDFRNVIIHEYFGISINIVWDIIKNELPPLEKEIRKLKESWKNET